VEVGHSFGRDAILLGFQPQENAVDLSEKKSSGFEVKLGKVGILWIGSDFSPPSISPLTTLARHLELPEIQESCFEIRNYALADVGTGFRPMAEVILEGQIYPYEYDPDRKSIRVRIPKSLAKSQDYALLEVRAFDFAGNRSQFFQDVVHLTSWKQEANYASCPAKE